MSDQRTLTMNLRRLSAPLILATVGAAAPLAVARAADAAPEHVTAYHEKGRFGGWPANHGIWIWGNEILVGFSGGFYKDLGPERHNIDRDRPEDHLLGRSKDGGRTWSIENPAEKGVLLGTKGMR